MGGGDDDGIIDTELPAAECSASGAGLEGLRPRIAAHSAERFFIFFSVLLFSSFLGERWKL